jgi:hypothetical protein
MLVDVSAAIRQQHGLALGEVALENVVALFPEFHRARSDLLVVQWQLADEAPEKERGPYLRRLLELFRPLDRSDLVAGPRAFICYAAVIATTLQDGPEAGRRLAGDLQKEIRSGDKGGLARRIKALLANPDAPWSVVRVPLN